MPAIAVKPRFKVICAMSGGLVSSGVGPLAQGGLDEAFDLAVAPGSVGLSEDVADAELEQV